MAIRSVNNTFNRGELDPALYARDDVAVYTKGARKLRNMISLWTGAARIAPGSLYVDVMVDRENSDAIITDADHVKGIDFLYDADGDIIYTIIVRQSNTTSSAIDIYYDDTLQATITTSPYTAAQIKDVHFAIGHDRILLLHESVQTRQLIRGANHTSWTLSTLSPRAFPTFDFSTVNLAPSYSAITFTLGAVSGTSVTLTASSAIFVSNHVGGYLFGFGDYTGTALITAVADSTNATVRIIEDFQFTSIAGWSSSLQERMWNSDTTTTPVSQNRGWPSRGLFYLNRLILGRTSVLKNITAVSTAGIYDNFDTADVDATTAFTVSFNGKGDQSIQSIIADDSLVCLTSNKVFAQSPLVETPLSAENVYLAPQTQSPATDIEATTIDNQILYVSANQSQVMQITYNTGDAKYMSVPASILSSHLFKTINSNGTWEPKGITTRLYMATQTDGSMLMFSTLIQQDVSAWSLRTTRGSFKQVIGDGRQASVIVEREVNLGDSTFETTLDYAYLTDSEFTAFYDVQSFFDSSMSSAVGVLENQYNYILMGNTAPFTAINIDFNLEASEDCGLTFEYLDNNGFWDTFTPTDNTVGFTTDGSITWTFDDTLNWFPNEVNDVENMYWIRIRRTTETVTTTPVIEQVELNTGTRLYLERLSFDEYMDSTTTASSDQFGNVTGLTHLAGQQVYAIQDGFTTGPYFVDDAGETTIQNLNADVSIGLQYKPLLVPMPLYTPTMQGSGMYAEKYVQDLYIDYIDSLYLQAGSEPVITDIPNMQLGNYTLGESVPPQSGIYKINPMGSWEPRQEIVITQSQPGPMTIIGVGYQVEVS